jgi:hypothetical protein
MSTEPSGGTTALPTSIDNSPVRVWYDPELAAATALQQPQTQQIAVFEAIPNDYGGKLLDKNEHFIVYAVKNGLIRVLHRHSSLRNLLRGHKGHCVTDLQFFQDGDVLATAAHDSLRKESTILIWRVFERPPEIHSEILLRVNTRFFVSRILWHPFNANQFWILHASEHGTTVATLMETTRIATIVQDGHAVCQVPGHVVMNGAIQLSLANSNLTDFCWSDRECRHVLTTFDSGEIVLWDLKQLSPLDANHVAPQKVRVLYDDAHAPSKCLFLPHSGGDERAWTSCFLTASNNNQIVTLWSAFGPDEMEAPKKLQVLELERPSASYLVDVCFGPLPPDKSPPSCFIVVADGERGNVFCYHCKSMWNEQEGKNKKALLVGCDYVVPFQTMHPMFSWSVESVPTTDISDEELTEQGALIFDIKLFAYQSTVVQSLTLTSYMCLPPENSWTDPTAGVRVERLEQNDSTHTASDVRMEANVVIYDEEYDLDEDVNDESYDAPDPSNLPPPKNMNPAMALVSNNPFANWLGAIASKTSGEAVLSPCPMPPSPAVIRDDVPPPPPPNMAQQNVPTSINIVEDSVVQVKPQTNNSREITPIASNKSPSTKKKEEGIDSFEKNTSFKSIPSPAPTIPRHGGVAPGSELISSNQGFDFSEFRLAVREELESIVVPQLEKSIETMLTNTVSQPIQSSIGRLAKDGIQVDNAAIALEVSASVNEALQAAFANSIKTIFIPTLESVAGQVFAQISNHMEMSKAAEGKTASKDLEAISMQLSTMTNLVAKLTTEVQSLREQVASQQPIGPPSPTTSIQSFDTNETVKREILAALAAKQYQVAFTKAVSSSTAELTVFCCSKADVEDVLGGSTPHLSQPILLCLMQQLGTILMSAQRSDLQVELEWLQEIALSLNPADANIQSHVPGVLQQLVAGINMRMAQNNESLRRPLQRLLQVVRGMLMG